MAFVVEDGTGLANSNSYGSFAGYVAYWTERGAAPTELQPAIEAALVKATDHLGIRYTWKGQKLTAAQALDWPRSCAYGVPTADYPCGVPLEGVPLEVQRATYELGKRALAGELAPDPTVDASGQTVVSSRDKVGPLETERTFNGGGSKRWVKSFPAVDSLLRWLVVTTSGRVWRA
jgi:hypothetical protein